MTYWPRPALTENDLAEMRKAYSLGRSLLDIGQAVSRTEMETAARKMHALLPDTPIAAECIERAEDTVRYYLNKATAAYGACRPYDLAGDMREEMEMALEDLNVGEDR